MRIIPRKRATNNHHVAKAKFERRKAMLLEHWCPPFGKTKAKDLLQHREKEILFRQKEETKKLTLPVHKKMTTASKLRAYPTSVKSLRLMCEAEEKFALSTTVDTTPGHIPPEHITKVTTDIHQATGKSVSDYIDKCRRILFIEQSLQIKHEEMRRMKEMAKKAEEDLEREEKKLEEDARRLDEFIHSSDATLLNAQKQLEEETIKTQKKDDEVKSEFSKLFIIKNEIAQAERLLGDYLQCAHFLEMLSPQVFEEETEITSSELEKLSARQHDPRSSTLYKGSVGDLLQMSATIDSLIESADEKTDMEPMKIPFESPHDLLKMMDDLKLQNLSLLKHRFYTLEALIEAEQKYKEAKLERDKENEALDKEMNDLKASIHEMEYKSQRLKEATGTISNDDMTEEEREYILKLEEQIKSTYNSCVGTGTENVNPFDMLVEIEKVLVSLLGEISTLPKQKLDKVHKMKQTQRISKERAEEAEERIRMFKERMQRKLERADLSSANKMRRRLMYRSPPLKKEVDLQEIAQRQQEIEEEEYAIFFT